MQKQQQRNRSLCQQTFALVWKNLILKWRMKTQSFQEWFPALLLLLLILGLPYKSFHFKSFYKIPKASLGQLDDPSFNFTGLKIVYTPGTKMAREVMEKVTTVSVMKDVEIQLVENEKAMELAQKQDDDTVGVVFQDDFSYRLRFSPENSVSPNDGPSSIDTCYNYSADYCKNPKYWFQGFLSLQSSIDSALIELITNKSVWDEMKSISGVRMRSPSIQLADEMEDCVFFLLVSICFSPFTYFLSQNVSREKRKLKEVMKTMGLQDTAFWLSWSLVYAVYILIMSCMLAAVVTNSFTTVSFSVLFLLFFFYGISSIHFCFMISSLLKKPKPTCFVVFFLTLGFGELSIVPLFKTLPASVEWTLSLFSPFAFGTALAKIFILEKYGRTFYVSHLMEELYLYALAFDIVFYMLLAFYFDKVVPDKYGVPYPPLFFLKKSYWCKPRSSYTGGALDDEQSHANIFNDNAEAVPPEFDGKEAIRLNNIKKTYRTKSEKTEALRGLSLNIYEGQITAVLGHTGAGKTTLLNILSGLSKPSHGSATILTYSISKREDMEQIRKISAVCPQFNVQFEHLTVKENLKTFARIKGIPSSDIENEIQTLLTLLDMNAIKDTHANNLSGGQKRKLSLAIAFLGDPQVLFLDEPTAGLDPYSRHQVWALLNERKAGRVTLFTTQFMDEADILADRKAFISHGRLQCVGSSLFLKKKWGIGYHLRMHINELGDPERTTALVKKYIPNGRLSGQRENELSYVLPLEHMEKFPALFCNMDQQTDLGIINYGITVTTLEDVFLKLEGNETTDEEGSGVLRGQVGEEKRADSSLVEVEQDLQLLSDTGKSTMRGTELWRQQVCTVARMHFLNLKRESKVWGAILFLSALVLAPVLVHIISLAVWMNLHNVELHPGLYFEPGTKFLTGYSGLLILNDTGASIDNFIQAVRSQNVLVEAITGFNVSDQLVHNGAIKVALQEKKYRFTLMCHMEVVNCFPVLINIISNALLRMSNSIAHIRIWNDLFLTIHNEDLWAYFANFYFIGSIVLFPAFPMHFAMNSARYYKLKSRAQLRVSGLFTSAYWCGLAMVDIPLCWILLLLVYGPWFLFIASVLSGNNASIAFILVFFVFGYGISIVLLLYIIAFLFRKKAYASSFWSFIFLVVSLFLVATVAVVKIMILTYLNHLMNFLIPMMTAINFSISLTEALFVADFEYATDMKNELIVSSIAPLVQSVIFVFLLGLLEMKYGRPVMRRDPVFRVMQAPLSCCRFSPARQGSQQNPEKPSEDEDRDVQEERERVQSVLVSANHTEKPVITVHNLRKEYKIKKACSCFRKKEKKVATRNVSFCVKKGCYAPVWEPLT
ncbi:ABC-type organic anion transporter ABCA8-like isoform X2 [Tiliqua scincoides]|uniref:ABC-type organic anion transporter ABCA8-like isoform X2 n=1 Tax=Tiliqua scincoides TaxID=71010 RepID=UPI003462231A